MNPRILLVDNVDSFTFNLYQYLGELIGRAPLVVTNRITPEELAQLEYDCIVISPGPGHPGRQRDFGVCSWLIEHASVPILGICLGHQGIGAHFGATVALAPEPMHGRSSLIRHDDDSLFEGIPSTFEAIRYHSLLLRDIPDCLEVTAECDGLVMAIRHRTRPIWGVQFHPESIGTRHGIRLLQNFLARVRCNDRRVENERSSATHHSQDVSVQTLRLLHEELPLECEADAISRIALAQWNRVSG